jgi:hypothetical protein
LATPLTITEGPSADDGDTPFDFDARQPVDPSWCFDIGDRVRVFEGTHAGVRGYKAIVYEGTIVTLERDYYYGVRSVISQRVRIVFVDDIVRSTCAADEHDSKPQKRAAVLESELEASGHANGVLSEKLARAKIRTSQLGMRLKTVETERDAAKASRDELEQQFDDFEKILLGREQKALTRCQGSVAGLFMKLAEDLLAPTIAGHEKAALRQENAAAHAQKVHARQICKLKDEFDKVASKLNVETLRANAAERDIAGFYRGDPKSGMLTKRGMAVAAVYKKGACAAADSKIASLLTDIRRLGRQLVHAEQIKFQLLTLWVCIAQGTNDGAAAASNRPGTCAGRSPGTRKVRQKPRDFGGEARGIDPAHEAGYLALFFLSAFALLCALPRAQTTGRLLLQTDLVRMKGCSQGFGRCGRCFGPSAGAHGVDPAPKAGYLALFVRY